MITGVTYSPATALKVDATHFAIASDPVSRLGDGHIGGPLLVIQKSTDSPIDAHRIAQFTGFVDGMTAVTDTQYALATAESDYLGIRQPLLASGMIASIGDDGYYTATEASLRAVSAVSFGLAQASATDVGEVIAAVFGDRQQLGDSAFAALEFSAGAAVGRFQASKQASLAARGIGAYALTLANVLQASAEFWEEFPAIGDALGVTLETFLSDIALPAMGVAGITLDAALKHEFDPGEHGEALQDFKHTREWLAAYDPSAGDNQVYVQGSELDDALVDHGSSSEWQSDGTRLYGYSGDDTLSAGAGDDYLHGGRGNDTLDGGTGDDLLIGGEGNDILRGGSGEDVYIYAAGQGHDVIDDGDRAGVILVRDDNYAGRYVSLAGHQRQGSGGTWSDDALFQWNGNGADLEVSGRNLGSDGSITIRNFHNGDYGIYLTGATATGHDRQFGLFDQQNTLIGSDGHDQLYGENLDDVLSGNGGDDELYGKAGDDQLDGGAGHDQMFGSDGDDVLIGGPGADQLFGGNGNNLLQGDDGNDEIFGSTGTDRIYGGAGADEMYGGEGSDLIYGGAGSDQLYGSGGADRIFGEAGVDHIGGGPGSDYLEGGEAHDFYFYAAGDGSDTIVDAGTNTLQFANNLGLSDLTLYEGESSLFINTGGADDTVEIRGYSASEPRSSAITRFSFHDGSYLSIEDLNLAANRLEVSDLFGDGLDNHISGSWAPEEIRTGAGDDIAEGNGGGDLLYGNRGNDLLDGGNGDDKLFGGKGNDTLLGGPGDDVLKGGPGSDTYVVAPGHGRDVIKNQDADTASNDMLEFQSTAHDQLWLTRKKDHLLIDVVGTDDRVKVRNWFASPDNQLDTIQAGGQVLLAEQVDLLVDAMAVFDAPSGVGGEIPQPVRAELATTLAASWQAVA